MSYHGLGQATPAAPTAQPWVDGNVFLANMGQELNRAGRGSTQNFWVATIQGLVRGGVASSINTNKRVRVTRIGPDSVVVEVGAPPEDITRSIPMSGPTDGMFAEPLARAYELSQHGYTLDTGLLARNALVFVAFAAAAYGVRTLWRRARGNA